MRVHYLSFAFPSNCIARCTYRGTTYVLLVSSSSSYKKFQQQLYGLYPEGHHEFHIRVGSLNVENDDDLRKLITISQGNTMTVALSDRCVKSFYFFFLLIMLVLAISYAPKSMRRATITQRKVGVVVISDKESRNQLISIPRRLA